MVFEGMEFLYCQILEQSIHAEIKFGMVFQPLFSIVFWIEFRATGCTACDNYGSYFLGFNNLLRAFVLTH